jgi:SAM-dependent methyltransferase
LASLREFRYAMTVAGLVRPAVKLALLRGGLDDGLFALLCESHTTDELAAAREMDRDLTKAWLRAAHEADLLKRDGAAYRAAPFVRWLLETDRGDAARAVLEGATEAYGPVLGRYPEILRTGEWPSWIGDAESASRVARGSRLAESRALRALPRIPGVRNARRFLDIGCGEGVYLLTLLERHRDSIGDGVELDPGVADRARQRLQRGGVGQRAEVHTGDFNALDLPHGTYDLVLLNNNLYYFDEDARGPLFGRILEHLSPRGILAIQCPFVSDDAVSKLFGMTSTMAAFDAFLQIHDDLAGLPRPERLNEQLRDAGFGAIGTVPIVPGGSLRYVWARKPKR